MQLHWQQKTSTNSSGTLQAKELPVKSGLGKSGTVSTLLQQNRSYHHIIMADDEHAEEQEMEAEALAAIFDTSFEVISPNPPLEWGIRLWPEQETGGDDGDANHVGIRLLVKLPPTYPDEGSAPKFTVEILKGLTTEHAASLETMALEEAESNGGMPVLYAVCEKLKEWLLENNEKGLDDRSAYAQMMAREKEKEREKVRSVFAQSDGVVQGGCRVKHCTSWCHNPEFSF